jgi:hypothetical protein
MKLIVRLLILGLVVVVASGANADPAGYDPGSGGGNHGPCYPLLFLGLNAQGFPRCG